MSVKQTNPNQAGTTSNMDMETDKKPLEKTFMVSDTDTAWWKSIPTHTEVTADQTELIARAIGSGKPKVKDPKTKKNKRSQEASSTILGNGSYGIVVLRKINQSPVATGENNPKNPTTETESPSPKQEGTLQRSKEYIEKVYNIPSAFPPAKFEGGINQIIAKYHEQIKNAPEKQAYLIHSADSTIVPLIGDPKTDKIFQAKAPGESLDKVLKERIMSQEEAVKCCVGVANGLAVAHESGIVHRDIKPANIMYDEGTKTTKLIDLGIAWPFGNSPEMGELREKADPTCLVNYCASLEQYKLLEKIQNNQRTCKEIRRSFSHSVKQEHEKELEEFENNRKKSLKQDLAAITVPATDVYGLGMIKVAILFGKDGYDKWHDLFCKYNHNYAPDNIAAREQFHSNVNLIVDELNNKLPKNEQYSPEQLGWIVKLIKACTDPDPTKRPTAAQVGEVLELMAAVSDPKQRAAAKLETENEKTSDQLITFDNAMELAKKDRQPATDGPIAKALKRAEEVYKKHGFTSKITE